MAVGYRGGLITGKIGGDVGYMVKNAKGRTSQGWRAYQAHVSNPNNPAQRFNRVILSTMAKAYSTLRPICDHSFEGISGASRNQKEFAKFNIRVLQGKAQIDEGNFNPRNVFDMLCNEYLISKGSLPSLDGVYDDTERTLMVTIPQRLSTSNPTMREFFDAMGWQDQGQITLCFCLGGLHSAKVQRFIYSRFVLKIGGIGMDNQPITDDSRLFITVGSPSSPTLILNYDASESINVGSISVEPGQNDSLISLKFTLGADYTGNIPVRACGYINSALVGNIWKRSTQVLDNIAGDDAGYTLAEAMASYSSVQNSSLYLNG